MVAIKEEKPLEEEPQVGEEQQPDEENEDREPSTQEDEEDQKEEVVVSIDGQPINDEPEQDNAVIREMRRKIQETNRKNQELRQELKKTEKPKQPDTLGPRPTLKECEYDEELFELKSNEWIEKKSEIKEREKSQNHAWKKKLDAYSEKKKKLRVKDFEDSEMMFAENFNVTQQGIVISGAQDPELVVYALGKNPKKAKELAAIDNYMDFAFAVARLEAGLKVSSRKPKTTPEKIVKGSGSLTGSYDSTLERLRAEAEKTGVYTEVNRHKKKMRAKSR